MPKQPNGVSEDAQSLENAAKEPSDTSLITAGDITDEPKPYAAPQTPKTTSNGVHVDGQESRGIKRKLSTPKDGAHRPRKTISPPWKKFEPKNPTSFSEGGIRKSGRTNALPLDLQEQGVTRKKHAAYVQEHDTKKNVTSPPSGKVKRVEIAQPKQSKQSNGVVTSGKDSHKKHGRTLSVPRISSSKDPPQSEEKRRKSSAVPGVSTDEGSQRRKSGRRRSTAAENKPVPKEMLPEQETNTPQPAARPKHLIRLNFRRPKPLPMNPGNIPPPKKYSSIKECFEQNLLPPEEGADRIYTDGDIHNEARSMRRLERAARPGGALYGDAWAAEAAPQAQDQPRNADTIHLDVLNEHVRMFVRALNQEQASHRRLAKELAWEARERWLRKQPRSAEQILVEKSRASMASYKTLVKELQSRWQFVTDRVKQQKVEEHTLEQKRKLDEDLQNLVEQSQATADARRQRIASIDEDRVESVAMLDDQEEYAVASSGDDADDSTDGSDSDVSMTTNEDSEDDEAASHDSNEDLSPEALRAKLYSNEARETVVDSNTHSEANGNVSREGDEDTSEAEAGISELLTGAKSPSQVHSDTTARLKSEAPSQAEPAALATAGSQEPYQEERGTIEHPTTDYSTVEVEEVDDALLEEDEAESSDDADDETEESESSDEDPISGSDDDDDDDDDDQAEEPSLLDFFGKQARKAFEKPPISTEADIPKHIDTGAGEIQPKEDACHGQGHVSPKAHPAPRSDEASTTDMTSGHDTPATTVGSKPSVAEGDQDESVLNHDAVPTPNHYRTAVPSLLRGQLREYQHQGLDWLVGMHDNGQNGILADEMGLGKTIQTIALLAHLADVHEIWGPHLIVVPTSVLLNWEMEFKKFLPGFKILSYYGSQDERKEKRKGWSDNDRWNVCITSYQLALADQQMIKRRNWHYMVLDEAHNIKNFRSQRWQTLLTFKSQARLLLTGTPLQNNLAELWSLLFFLDPGINQHSETSFTSLKEFSTMFKKPVESILDSGREGLDDEGRESVTKLHTILRPLLLRRLKADVEKQMPKKYEHVVRCRLSKRQRQLYDGYMGLAGTRESFASGNYISIIDCLAQLRKVCNHPDLFETRQIVTSFAMPKSAIAEFEVKELLVRRTIISKGVDEQLPHLLHLWRENLPSLLVARSRQLAALKPLEDAYHASEGYLQWATSRPDYMELGTALANLELNILEARKDAVLAGHRRTRRNLDMAPVFPSGLIGRHTFEKPPYVAHSRPKQRAQTTEWELSTSTVLRELFSLNPAESQLTELAVRKFGCVTPAAVAPGLTKQTLTNTGVEVIQSIEPIHSPNPFHESQTRLSIAFPDKSLIQYDCGKLQQLDRLLRQLQAGGHRALIFTQMTRVLDILEQFLNLHGHRYLRLDGSTKIESRQALTEQFNTDPRILAFILSSRSGGLGINLTGADTVIFYDLDWNPAMDKQCQDRCHRIGQTRDVHIYRFVSEGTIEANILRKSNQKRMLDEVVIQEGEFTTDTFYRTDEGDEADEDAAAALNVVFGASGQSRDQKALEQAEDQEDVLAARQAQKEDAHVDDADFQEKPTPSTAPTPDAKFESSKPEGLADVDAAAEVPLDGEEEPVLVHLGRPIRSFEEYMLAWKREELKDAVIVTMSDAQKKKAKKGREHGIRIRA